jgi:YHS domain-containing protein
MSLKTVWLAALTLTFALSAALVAAEAKDKPTTKPYPLATCVVSGEKLGGDMGDPYVIKYKGREVRFCCKDCETDFRKNPDKYLKKLDEAAATQPSTQPAAGRETHD